MAFDLYPIVAAILVFTFLTTLRFSLTGDLATGNPILRIVTHPWWLYALVLAGPFVLGAFYKGLISPWPPQAYAEIGAQAGRWAGAAAALGATIVDIWIFWGGATTFAVSPHRPISVTSNSITSPMR